MAALEVLDDLTRRCAELKLELSLRATDLDSTDLLHASSCIAGAGALVEAARRRLLALVESERTNRESGS
jgi:hypothetical protein